MAKIRIRRGIESKLPLLDEGEFGFTTDTKKLYIGTSSGNQLLINTSDVSGDMFKGIYDTNNDGKVDWAEKVDWSGIQNKPSTYPPSTHDHNTVYIQKSLSSVSDFNNALTEGEMSIGSSTSLANAPYTGSIYGKLRIYVNDGGTHNNLSNWIWQYFDDTSGKQYFRNKTNSSAWSAWVRLDASAFASASHNHDTSYLTKGGVTWNNLKGV
ncbi:hypothetical protein JOC70_000356 [Clostridium pascui]|uniref:hyaluronate lyase N-terminal domain-containing protein n=1 Tax=Clostridium pascui TaxID=46609 RepID=UPI00195A63F3|nr:hypothetical protein [Clostridium pascui]